MAPAHSKLHRRVIKGQSREIIANVLTFMKKECNENGFTIPVKKVYERVSSACGVSVPLIKTIKKELHSVEAGTSESFRTPIKNKNRPRPRTDLDDFDMCVIRSTIHDFYTKEKKVPTVKNVLPKLREIIQYKGSRSSLLKVFKKVGFRWKKTQNNRRVLIERNDVKNARISYLRAITRFRQEGRPIVYSDETYIHSSHTTTKAWADDSREGLKFPVSKGQRLIIVHAGGETGFIPNTLLIFKSNTKTGDYHSEMNSTNYQRWIKEKVLPNLPPKSVYIVDNASYHNVEIDKSPTSSTKKTEMQDWLLRNNIPFTHEMYKPELYELIKLHKPNVKKYMLDNMLNERGHTVLRLPAYHPDLNSIEKIWGDVKQWVAERNVTFQVKDVWQLCEQRFAEMGEAQWGPVCRHVIQVEQEYMRNESLLEPEVEPLCFKVNGDSYSSYDDSMSDESIQGLCDEGMSGIEELE